MIHNKSRLRLQELPLGGDDTVEDDEQRWPMVGNSSVVVFSPIQFTKCNYGLIDLLNRILGSGQT